MKTTHYKTAKDKNGNMQTIEQTDKPTACPICDKRLSLAYIRASDGREWVNSACPPCGYAMNEKNQWTFYVGGMTRLG
jgi:hypothetical protein